MYSRYLFAQAVGGIVVSPFSETFGRRTLYLYASAVFLVFNVVIAAPSSFAAVFVGRFFTGFVASIPATVAFGNFNDMFDAKWRIWIVYFYTLAGNSGIVLGPIYASYISRAIGWRWIFWSTCSFFLYYYSYSNPLTAFSRGHCFSSLSRPCVWIDRKPIDQSFGSHGQEIERSDGQRSSPRCGHRSALRS